MWQKDAGVLRYVCGALCRVEAVLQAPSACS